MKKYNVLIETENDQLFLFPMKADSAKHANALVMRESVRHEFLDGVEIATIAVFEEGNSVNKLENTIRD